MCVTWTEYFTCGCADGRRDRSNNCDGTCTGDAIVYSEAKDVVRNEPCFKHQYLTPPSSSDESVSDGASSEESADN